MDDITLQRVMDELGPALVGRSLGKMFQMSRLRLSLDFHLRDGRFLLVSAEPASPRIHLVARKLKDMERHSGSLSPFGQVLRKHLRGLPVTSVAKDEGDRIVRIAFAGRNDIGITTQRTLIAQMTGRSANLLLLDDDERVIDTLRSTNGEGQQIGDRYAPPSPPPATESARVPVIGEAAGASVSQTLDEHYSRLDAERAFISRTNEKRARLLNDISKRKKLLKNLDRDLDQHGDADEHKRIGDLLLANLSSAERSGDRVVLIDYFSESTPRLEIVVDEDLSLQQEATRRFARYRKSKRAAQEISIRVETIRREIENLENQLELLERIVSSQDSALLEQFDNQGKTGREVTRGKKAPPSIPGVRRYRSTDGFEIMMGRAARDNDELTFHIARPNDLWFHAADYPGSHVIVRNPSRNEIPYRTVLEAAQLAAYYSQARADSKVDVHFTPRKFISKPRGTAPGLVRMSDFRTITVEPREAIERL